MACFLRVTVLVTFAYITQSNGGRMPTDDRLERDDNSMDLFLNNKFASINEMQDAKLETLIESLSYVLTRFWPVDGLPLLYVENLPNEEQYYDQSESDEPFQDVPRAHDNEAQEYSQQLQVPIKKSRYYRKFQWKRQNSREAYEAENRYLCQPSKDDVYRLLVALHEARQGNRGHSIEFCNRKRPAVSIFTNIRFLGKRK